MNSQMCTKVEIQRELLATQFTSKELFTLILIIKIKFIIILQCGLVNVFSIWNCQGISFRSCHKDKGTKENKDILLVSRRA